MKPTDLLLSLVVLITGVFAALPPLEPIDDAIFEGLPDLSEAANVFTHHPQQHVAPSSSATSFSDTSASRPQWLPVQAHGAPSPYQQWQDARRAASANVLQHNQWQNVQSAGPAIIPHQPHWNNYQPPNSAHGYQYQHYQGQSNQPATPAIVPQQKHWNPFEPAGTADVFQHQHWSDSPRPYPAPQQLVDRGPDDLSAVVSEYKRKSLVFRSGSSSQEPSIHSTWQPGPEQPHYPVQPASYYEFDSDSPPAFVHVSKSLYEGHPLLHLANRPAKVVYQEDAAADEVIVLLKDDLQIRRQGRPPPPRALLPSEVETATSNLNDLLRRWRPFKEYILGGRRFLVLFLRTQTELTLKKVKNAASIWEFTTDGRQTVMLCRGFYGIDTTYFKDFAGIQTEHIYNVRIEQKREKLPQGVPNRLEIMLKVDEDHIPFETRRVRVLKSKQIVDSDPVQAAKFSYLRQEGIEQAYSDWLSRYPKRNKNDPSLWQELRPPEDSQQAEEWHRSFGKQMFESFMRRSALREVEYDGETYFLSHHPGYKRKPLPSTPFAAIWKHENDGQQDHLVAVGLYPIKRTQFNTAVLHSKALNRKFKLVLSRNM